jgi:flagellar hook-associated protein 1 FlgK
MPSVNGKLAALAAVRDTIGNTFQLQLDEISRGLIDLFSESDQSMPPALPDRAGLFMDGTDPAIPPPSGAPTGLSSRIRVNPLGDPGQGGNVFLLRDGGFGGPAYSYNATAVPSFQNRLTELQHSFDLPQAFRSEAQLGTTGSIKSFSAESAGWMESLRQSSNAAREAGLAQKTRSSEALLRVTGVNVDEEMAAILDLEKSYQASAKVISAIDSMLASLLEAIR